LTGYILAFTEDFLRAPDHPVGGLFDLDNFHGATKTPTLRASAEQARILVELLERMNQEFTHKNAGYVSVLRASFQIFMVNLQRIFADELKEAESATEHRLARRFKRLVAERYGAQTRIQEYAEILNVSVSRLNDVIKKATDLTPGQIVRNEQVLAAKRLLAHSDLNVAEICFRLNFEDPSYFGRFFKRETGFSPSDFRGEMRKKYRQLAQ